MGENINYFTGLPWILLNFGRQKEGSHGSDVEVVALEGEVRCVVDALQKHLGCGHGNLRQPEEDTCILDCVASKNTQLLV